MLYALTPLLAICIHLIINISIFAKKRRFLLPGLCYFRFFFLSVLAYHMTDALWGIFYEHKLLRPLVVDTYCFFVTMALSVLLWTQFVVRYLRENNIFTKLLKYAGLFFCLFQVIAAMGNNSFRIFFYFDADVTYHTAFLRHISFIVQMLLFLATGIYSLHSSAIIEGKQKRRYRMIGLCSLFMAIALAIQIFDPLLPMYSIGWLLGGCILHIFVLEDTKEEYHTTHDRLTDLPNLVLLAEQFPRIIAQARRTHSQVGLLFMDLDNFKSVNTCHGYQQGDAVLYHIAQRLSELVSTHLLARAYADDFQIILVAQSEVLIKEQADTLMSVFDEPFLIQGNSLYISASMGLAIFDAESPLDFNMFHCAELAMFDAKKRGGNTISLYKECMRSTAYDKKQLETALHKAVEDNAFTVFYQPKISMAKHDVVGCEALIRWQIHEGTWISPADFIPLAEETLLITRIDMFVLRCACRQVLLWKNAGLGSISVAVNMSAHSILSAGFADNVIRILHEEGTPPGLIDIEITESCFISDMDSAFAVIAQLHEAGIHIALDDFGTGYSSLQYLSAMPISYLKIDRQFVKDLFSGKVTARPLVKSILSLAGSLNMQTISEGVEDQEQLAFLVDNGADIIQGFLFSKPLSAKDFEKYLRHCQSRIAAVLSWRECAWSPSTKQAPTGENA